MLAILPKLLKLIFEPIPPALRRTFACELFPMGTVLSQIPDVGVPSDPTMLQVETLSGEGSQTLFFLHDGG
jgi:hypothetical protein